MIKSAVIMTIAVTGCRTSVPTPVARSFNHSILAVQKSPTPPQQQQTPKRQHPTDLRLAKLVAKIATLQETSLRHALAIERLRMQVLHNEVQKARSRSIKVPEHRSAELEKKYTERLAEGISLYGEKKFGFAYLVFAELDKAYPPKVSDYGTRLWMAKCWLELKEFEQAKLLSDEFLKKAPKSSMKPQALLVSGIAKAKLGEEASARKAFDELLKKFPQSSEAAQAKVFQEFSPTKS